MLKQPTSSFQHGLRVSLLATALFAALPAAAQTRLSLGDLQAQISALQTLVTNQQSQITSLQSTLAATQSALTAVQGNSVLGLNGVLSYDGARQTALFSGVDVQVVNGSYGVITGRGNLIVGYNDPRSGFEICSDGRYATQTDCEAKGGIWAVDHKSGSHNLVVGEGHAYSDQYGTLLGYGNAATGWAATVTGGNRNTASGYNASVSGGYYNTASGGAASVSGGYYNTASGGAASVSSGRENTASGGFTSVSGGYQRQATATNQWVAGGLSQPR